MIIFLIIYILGIIASLWLGYYSLESGEEVSLYEIVFALTSSLFSWITFIILILVIYGDGVVFKKK